MAELSSAYPTSGGMYYCEWEPQHNTCAQRTPSAPRCHDAVHSWQLPASCSTHLMHTTCPCGPSSRAITALSVLLSVAAGQYRLAGPRVGPFACWLTGRACLVFGMHYPYPVVTICRGAFVVLNTRSCACPVYSSSEAGTRTDRPATGASTAAAVPLGWLNLLGQVAAVSAVSFLCSGLISTMVGMAFTMNNQEPFTFTPAQVSRDGRGCGREGMHLSMTALDNSL